jgi:integrase/recombinase XerD
MSVRRRGPDTTADLIDRFGKDLKLRDLSPITCRIYPQKVTAFACFLQGDLKTVDKETLKSYLGYLKDEKGLKKKSIRLTFTALASFYDYLEDEKLVTSNPVRSMTKYLRSYKQSNESQNKQLISVEEAAMLVNSVLDTRDKAIILLLLKTGIRCNELLSLDIQDLNLTEMTIRLKPTPKRSNRIVYFDQETADVLSRWLKAREARNKYGSSALFLSTRGKRLEISRVEKMLEKRAEMVGLHDSSSKRTEDHLTPHCCRHWFTTQLIRAGMSRDFVKELRGDVRGDAIDIYIHIDKKELQDSYLAHIPQLGI